MTLPSLLLTPEEAADALRISRTRIYELLGSGRLRSVQLGRSRRIEREALLEFIRVLGTEDTEA